MQSTNPLTEEENNFLDHIEQKIHQEAARNADEPRQRNIRLFFIFQIKHEKDMKPLHERLERERIEREKKHAQQQADLQAQLARDLAPLRRPCFPFC